MMFHLLEALAQGLDIGHYGRLVFVNGSPEFSPESVTVRRACGSEARARLNAVGTRLIIFRSFRCKNSCNFSPL